MEHVFSTSFADERVFPAGTIAFDCALTMRNIAHEWHASAPMYVEAPADRRFAACRFNGGLRSMSEYKVIAKEVTSIVWRDVEKAGLELASDVNAELKSGWEPQGGIASIQAGTGVYLIQALYKRK